MKASPALAAAALLAAACGHDRKPQSFAGLSRVSGQSPFPSSCIKPNQLGANFASAEVEPYLAIDPLNARHLIGVWQQDRWSNGGANGLGSAVSFDGGLTWTAGFPAFTSCSGGTAALRTDFERASDPWVTFAADGTPHQIGFAFDNTSARAAMLAVRSTDGGRTWTDPIFLAEDNNPDIGLDKESITADPADPKLVYAVWDRLEGLTTVNSGNTRGPAWFTRTTDGGATWEPARAIYDPGANAQTIANQVQVLPNGVLVNFMTIITQLNQASSPARLALVRSADKGVTWSAVPDEISALQARGVFDPKSNLPVRTGDIVPAFAADPATGDLYAAWEDSRVTAGARDGIALSRSSDGGVHWSPLVRVNARPEVQAFTPSVSARGGKVAVTYYDLRDDDPGDDAHLFASVWQAVSSDGGATWQETAAGGPFDLRNAPRTEQGWFVGDYTGLVPSGAIFLPLFVLGIDGNTANRTDVFARPPGAAVAAAPLWAASFEAPRLPRSGLRRAY